MIGFPDRNKAEVIVLAPSKVENFTNIAALIREDQVTHPRLNVQTRNTSARI